MSQFPTVPAIWLGDFNNIMHKDLDRLTLTLSDNPTHSYTIFGKLLTDLALVDIWRHRHPTDRAFSCFSTSYNSMSWIDLILISHAILPILGEVGFNPRVLSDHAPYWITLRTDPSPKTYTWKLNPFWLTVIPELEDVGAEWEFFFQTNKDTAPFEMIWGAFKSYARMLLSQRISRYRQNSSQVVRQAE